MNKTKKVASAAFTGAVEARMVGFVVVPAAASAKSHSTVTPGGH